MTCICFVANVAIKPNYGSSIIYELRYTNIFMHVHHVLFIIKFIYENHCHCHGIELLSLRYLNAFAGYRHHKINYALLTVVYFDMNSDILSLFVLICCGLFLCQFVWTIYSPRIHSGFDPHDPLTQNVNFCSLRIYFQFHSLHMMSNKQRWWLIRSGICYYPQLFVIIIVLF